jgi:hypothetical protein
LSFTFQTEETTFPMNDIFEFDSLGRDRFSADPFGYSAFARQRWGIARSVSGFPTDTSKPPTAEELKDPILWVSQAYALSEAAVTVLKNKPEFKAIPAELRGACDSQYCSAGLMLVGYSLEICLKGLRILRDGIEEYSKYERDYRHHNLLKLADFVPNISEKDRAILRLLTIFVYWAGRYPDPGTDKENEMEEIFTLAETHHVSAADLFNLSGRVMAHLMDVVG